MTEAVREAFAERIAAVEASGGIRTCAENNSALRLAIIMRQVYEQLHVGRIAGEGYGLTEEETFDLLEETDRVGKVIKDR